MQIYRKLIIFMRLYNDNHIGFKSFEMVISASRYDQFVHITT